MDIQEIKEEMNHLTWKIDKTTPTACPDYKPDPYTGEYPSFHCAVYHCETITKNRSAEFNTREEAIKFFEKAPLSCYDFQLDGKLLEDKRERPSSITIRIGGLVDTSGTGTTLPN